MKYLLLFIVYANTGQFTIREVRVFDTYSECVAAGIQAERIALTELERTGAAEGVERIEARCSAVPRRYRVEGNEQDR